MLLAMLGIIQLAAFTACSEDDYSGDHEAPVIKLAKETDKWVPGREYTIQGQITENTGMKQVHIESAELGLNEDINFGRGLVTDFKLVYPFDVPAELPESGSYVINITALDVAGNASSSKMTLSLDGDVDAPVFAQAPKARVDLVGKPNMSYALEMKLTDNKQLKSLQIICPELSIDETVDLTGTEQSVKKDFPMPSEMATYNFTYVLTDAAGLTTTLQSVVAVADMPDFEDMYLTDVFTTEELNADEFGVPVYMDKTSSHNYEILFYSDRPNKEIMFIPQPDSFSPNCFGAGENGGVEYAESMEGLKKFVLPKKGYYRIHIDVKNRTFTADPETVKADKKEVYITGAGIVGRSTWGLDHLMQVLDPDNPYELYDEVEFGNRASFCTSTAGWLEIWTPAPNRGPNVRFKIRTKAFYNNYGPGVGKFIFKFNYVTGQSSLVPVKE